MPPHIHLTTVEAPVVFKGQSWIDLMQESALGVLDVSLNMSLAAAAILSSLTVKTFQNYFFYMFVLADKIFHGIDPMGEIIS